jgi:hypothetical protein
MKLDTVLERQLINKRLRDLQASSMIRDNVFDLILGTISARAA